MVVFNSCDDMLFQDPISQISTSNFWQSDEDARAALMGMYVRLRTQAVDNFFLWGEARSNLQVQSFFVGFAWIPIFENFIDPVNSGPDWMGMYTVLHEANLILKYVPDIQFNSENEKKEILAQAHATRAFVYFILAKTWGDVPLVFEPTEAFDAESTYKQRTSTIEIFNFIRSELDQAIGLFPNNEFPRGRNLWSKPATQVLKADVLLWSAKRLNGGNADLNEALNSLIEAENSDVGLLQDFKSIFDYNNKGNREILMSVRFQEFEAPHTFHRNMYISGAIRPRNTDQETLEAIGDASGGAAYFEMNRDVVNMFNEADQRKKASFIEIYEYDSEGVPNYYTSVPSKFQGTVVGGVRQFLDDVVIYRYADILLLKAEAKNALGMDPSDEINLIRERAYGEDFPNFAFVSKSQEENDEEILQERLFELLLEGKYWWDLIKFNKVFERVPALQNREHMLVFPISETTLSLNPLLVQTQGYEFD